MSKRGGASSRCLAAVFDRASLLQIGEISRAARALALCGPNLLQHAFSPEFRLR